MSQAGAEHGRVAAVAAKGRGGAGPPQAEAATLPLRSRSAAGRKKRRRQRVFFTFFEKKNLGHDEAIYNILLPTLLLDSCVQITDTVRYITKLLNTLKPLPFVIKT